MTEFIAKGRAKMNSLLDIKPRCRDFSVEVHNTCINLIRDKRIRDWATANYLVGKDTELAFRYLSSVLSVAEDSTLGYLANEYLLVKNAEAENGHLSLSALLPIYLMIPKRDLQTVMEDLHTAARMHVWMGIESGCKDIIKKIITRRELLISLGLDFDAVEVFYDGEDCQVAYATQAKKPSVMQG